MTTEKHIKPVIVLDGGGVLVDYDVEIAFKALPGRLNAEIMPSASLDLDELFSPLALGRLSWQDILPILNNALGVTLGPEKWQELWCRIFTGEVQGMRKILADLKSEFRWVALSNTIEVHWRYLLNNYPIFRLLDGWVVSYEEGVAKPDSAIYKLVEDRYCAGGPPLFYTDDSPENIDAARRLGWDAEVFCDSKTFKREVLKRSNS